MFQRIRTAAGLHFVIGMVGRSPDGPVVDGGIRAPDAAFPGAYRGGARRGRARRARTSCGCASTSPTCANGPPPAMRSPRSSTARSRPPRPSGVTQLVEPGMLIEIDAEAARGLTQEASLTRFGGPIRVGLLTPYFAFFEARFPADFRATQAGLCRRAWPDALAGAGLEVTASGLVDGPEAAAGGARRGSRRRTWTWSWRAATMAAPPTYGTAALDGLRRAGHRLGRPPRRPLPAATWTRWRRPGAPASWARSCSPTCWAARVGAT